ncbi:uroporphyrinogen-III C-methyltransferase [Paenalcaligenes niemegkensis]|uniref:uroporphyrinogen-III C-methyltransferase n=1 Tax=Paenalcaligenes niemegkensis TaxID=2895469 RepID=UPI001EE9302C|nr:uroporphyrinogen-III C-methyltransferase [Paenalcaligenes niemegkensis]MCQ9616197.1 uroporphyrinogen-III C-methyltransferase [Paenalcaligenes niemegkensis]
MTDKTDKKTETEKIIQVETKSKPEVIPVADSKPAATVAPSQKAPEPVAASQSTVSRDPSGRTSEDSKAGPAAKPSAEKSATAGVQAATSVPPKAASPAASDNERAKAAAALKPPHEKTASSGSGGGGSTVPPAPPASYGAKKDKSSAGPVLLTAVVIAAIAGGTIWYLQQQNSRHSADLEQQLQANIRASHQAGEQAQQALTLVREQQSKLLGLEKQLADTREQATDLHQAFQTLTDAGTEVILLNDIDHLVTIAQQQLLLGGNIANAIVSLETAQARLARANRPTLASLQQTINGDVERLRATSTTDVPSLSRQLDLLSEQLNKAPLLMPDDTKLRTDANPTAAPSAPLITRDEPDPADPWWKRTGDTALHWVDRGWAAVRQDLGEFITIRRVDDASALLLSPEQASRFRDNLRLRVSSAKLALMTNQPTVWEAETAAIVNAIEQRFDGQSAATAVALRNASALSQVQIVSQLPNVDNSLSAIEALLQGQANKTVDRPNVSVQPEVEATDPPSPAEEPEASPQAGSERDAPDAQPDAPASDSNVEPGDESSPADDNVHASLEVTLSNSLRAEPVVYRQE